MTKEQFDAMDMPSKYAFAYSNPEEAQKLRDMPASVSGAAMLSPEQISQMNASNQAYQQQTAALQAQVAAQEAANKAGPQITHNPIDEATGALKDQYKVKGGEGYVQSMLAKLGTDQANAQDAAAGQAQAALTNATANMGMRGGLSSGNRLALTRTNMQDALKASQNVANQGLQARNNIGIKGAEMDTAADQTNIQNTLAGIGGENTFNLEKYKQNMAVDAANKQADATVAATRNDGSWVCTEVHARKPLTRDEALALFKLKRFALSTNKDLANFYFKDCKNLVKKMVKEGDDWEQNNAFVHNTIQFVREGKMMEAFNYYVKYIEAKVDQYWPDCNFVEFKKLKGEI